MVTRPFVAVPNTLQLEAIYTCKGERCENVFHVQGAGITDLSALANKVMDQYSAWDTANTNTFRGNDTQLTKMVVRDMGTQNGQVWERAVTGTIPTNAASAPNNVSLAIKWLTGYAGRSNRGRTFIIGLAQAMIVNNRVADTNAAQIITAYQNLLTRLTDATVFTGFTTTAKMVVVSRYTKDRPAGPAVTRTITGCNLVDTVVDSQRRRLPFHNRHR